MCLRCLRPFALTAGFALLVLVLGNTSATAGWPGHPGSWRGNPAEGYAVPLQSVYQFPAALVTQPRVPPYPVFSFLEGAPCPVTIATPPVPVDPVPLLPRVYLPHPERYRVPSY